MNNHDYILRLSGILRSGLFMFPVSRQVARTNRGTAAAMSPSAPLRFGRQVGRFRRALFEHVAAKRIVRVAQPPNLPTNRRKP